ncbi:hypothetical protein HMPREF1250_0511 [Megasphaera vaginalis (ex Srinivasan et al. 2021)]|uniref:Uncharacterized protein n=1 Tax=Megasphaera vaginalis (ex Srinivasan et al. 2021) TaxID=1111454 RepID=U7UPV5_9FIRM|nr:hypothetical protein HMPREF1250_0511 [Megasphaera vaginalis (ex Srinivasan et al. 2021)]
MCEELYKWRNYAIFYRCFEPVVHILVMGNGWCENVHGKG